MKIDDDTLHNLRLVARDLTDHAMLAFWRREQTTFHDERIVELIAEIEPLIAKVKAIQKVKVM